MRKRLAFVLSGGGGRGALQVGALKALLEAGFQPDLLIGTSIGAVNATFLAVNGVCLDCIQPLTAAWREAASADLMGSNTFWLAMRALFQRGGGYSNQRLREFFIAHGLTAELRFHDIHGVTLAMISANLTTGQTALYGLDPNQLILDGLLASTALPPWIPPIEGNGQILVDGGILSNLPVEPALSLGATEIIALDLADPREYNIDTHGMGKIWLRLINAIEIRQQELEMAIASACKVPVHYIPLIPQNPVNFWDFRHTDALIDEGYRIAKLTIQDWQPSQSTWWKKWFRLERSHLNARKETHRFPIAE